MAESADGADESTPNATSPFPFPTSSDSTFQREVQCDQDESTCRRKQVVVDNLQHVLRHVVDLRDAGMEARYFVQRQDSFRLYPRRQAQYLMAALISLDHIPTFRLASIDAFLERIRILDNYSELESIGFPECDLERNMLKIYNETKRQKKCHYFHHENVAFVMNCSTRYFLTHGECRLFDPKRILLYKIIDRKTNGSQRRNSLTSNYIGDECQNVLSEMKRCFTKQYGSLANGVFLVYSHNIPCNIAYHECSTLLNDYVQMTGDIMCIGFEKIHELTNRRKTMANLMSQNIVLLSNKDVAREIRNRCNAFDQENEENVEDWDFIDDLADRYS